MSCLICRRPPLYDCIVDFLSLTVHQAYRTVTNSIPRQLLCLQLACWQLMPAMLQG